ncbi:MAG: nicotinamidase [Candidatus Komeilibacteria bacterium]
MYGPDWGLLVVDVQNDFCPGGSLAVPQGDDVVPVINRIMREHFGCDPRRVFFSRDWHPANSRHFAANGGQWPVHCVRNTTGADFHPGLEVPPGAIIVSKGVEPDDDGYSAFSDRCVIVDPYESIHLERLLKLRNITHLVVVGLATDYCVKATVIDARQKGFVVGVTLEACRAVNLHDQDLEQAISEMMAAGAVVLP